jgi:putative transposase
MGRDLVIDGLLMAVWRRKPQSRVLVHSDQGLQYGSDDWHWFCREHDLEPSMSRRGNCWDNPKRRHIHIGGVSPEAFERASAHGL